MMDPEELAPILKREFESADSYHDQLEQLQDYAFKYYEAQPFGNEMEGRSQIILPDVQDNVDKMKQSVLRTFVSGDRTVEFEASDEGDEDFADDATAAIDYIFMRKADGYRTLDDATNDGLLRKIGVFKAAVEEEEKVSRQRVQLESPDQLGLLPEGVEVEDFDEATMKALLKTERTEKRFMAYAIPTNEFRFSSKARHEDTADYVAHVRMVSRSDLVEMGFDRDQIEMLPAYEGEIGKASDYESDKLDAFQDVEESSEALQQLMLCEEYARIDVDGDGIAERVKVFRVENEILIDAETGEPSIETVDEQPFAVFTPFPRPHHLVGYSLADKVMDIQLARSTIARQMFDGMDYANMPRNLIAESAIGDNTLDDLLNPVPGGPIRVNDVGGFAPLATNFNVGDSLGVMEWVSGEGESRSGITKMNQGLDADAINKTATGTAMMQAAGETTEEYVARNLAETVGRLFMKLYRLMRLEGEMISIRVDGKYRQIDPSEWPESMNMRVRVGLGTNSKDKRIAARFQLAPILAEGYQNGAVEPKHLFNAVDGLVRDLALGQGEDFWTDPDAEPEIDPQTGQPVERPEKPDPEAQAAQAEMQAKQAELQMKQQDMQARQQMDQQKAQFQMEMDQMKAQAAMESDRERNAMQMEVAREKAALDAQLARDRAEFEADLAERKMAAELAMAKAQGDAKMSENRRGGELDK